MPRYFTRDLAEQLLPTLEPEIRQAVHLNKDHRQAESELERIATRVRLAGGMLVDRDRLLALRARRDAAAQRLQEILESIQSQGCHIKDLDSGLLDFPTLFRGEEVLLCWKLGEPRIVFWHGLDEGFRGRKEIDREFLENHRGEFAQ